LFAIGTFLISAVGYGQMLSQRSNCTETSIGADAIPGVTELRTSPPSRKAMTTTPSTPQSQLTFRQRFERYLNDTYRPVSLLGPGVGAALTQWTTHNPRQWGQGFDGYGRRFASGYGRNVISNTIALPIAYLDHEDPRHYRSDRKGIWPRARYALVHTFVTRKTTGGEMPFFSHIIGTYSAAFAANAWYPAASADTAHALYRGSTAMAASIVYSELFEFWPDLKQMIPHNRHSVFP
jgi:hypothetical protein